MYRGERFNGISHLLGAVLALAGLVWLVVLAARQGDPWRIVSFSVYGTTLFLLYFFSTLYHSLRGRAKAVFRRLDHLAIYLLIAGTYTPFALVTLRGGWGWSLFGIVWGLAIAGMLLEFRPRRGETANGTSLSRGPRLGPIGETATRTSLARGPRLDPIGETANGPSLARGPRLDPIGETANGPSLARGPRLGPIGERVLPIMVYLVMGWLVLIALGPLIEVLPPAGLAWLIAGGLLYTAGLVFYGFDRRLRHAHGIWHLFVLGGSLCHYLTVVTYVA